MSTTDEATINQLRYCLARVVAHLRNPESAYARGDDDADAIEEAEAALKGDMPRGWAEAEAHRQDGAAEQYFEHRERIAFLEGILRDLAACDPFPDAGSFPAVSVVRDRARAALEVNA